MRLVDTHAHLNDRRFARDVPAVIERAAAAGVERIVVCGYDLPSSRAAVEMAALHEPVYAAVGVHPHDAKTYGDTTAERIRELARMPKVAAIGEIGLDFHRDLSPRPDQIAAFEAQLALAAELALPVIVHDREAHRQTLEVIERCAANIVGCVFHCFSGDERFAREVLDAGFYLGFDGPVTYPDAATLRRVVAMCPLDRILIETDSPYLTPAPHRGKRNEPACVRLVADAIAAARGMPVQEVAEQTTNNARTLFGFRAGPDEQP